MSKHYGIKCNDTKDKVAQQKVETFESKSIDSLTKQLGDKIDDLNNCRTAIISKGVEVPQNTNTSEYAGKILQISGGNSGGADLDAFISGNLRSVESGLTIVPDFAFSGKKNLEEVSLPNAEYIGNYAFTTPVWLFTSSANGSSSSSSSEEEEEPEFTEEELASIREEEEVQASIDEVDASINELTSFDNRSLKSVLMPNAVTIQKGAFQKLPNLEVESLPDSICIIDENAFRDCPKVVLDKLPDSLMFLGEYAFDNSILKEPEVQEGVEESESENTEPEPYCEVSITEFPENLYYVGKCALPEQENLDLSTMSPNFLVLLGGVSRDNFNNYIRQFIDEETGFLDFSRIPSLWLHLKFEDTNGRSDKFRDFSEIIGGDVYLSSDVGVISGSCFCAGICDNDTNLILENIHTIESDAFKDCSHIVSLVDVNNDLRNIGNYAFSGCARLAGSLDLRNIDDLGGSAFCNCRNITEVLLPTETDKIREHCFYHTSITEILIPQNVEWIENGAFGECGDLEVLTFAENSKLQSIDYSAFSGCDALRSVTIPQKVWNIGSEAFYWCTSIEELIFSEFSSLRNIRDRAFANCRSIQSNLTVVMCGDAYIDNFAFYNLEALETLKIITNECTDEEAEDFGIRSLLIYSDAFNNCYNLNVLDLSESNVTNIYENAFYCCPAIETVILPPTVRALSASAFSDEACLKVIDLTSFTMESIEEYGGEIFKFWSLSRYEGEDLRILFSSQEVADYFGEDWFWDSYTPYFEVVSEEE